MLHYCLAGVVYSAGRTRGVGGADGGGGGGGEVGSEGGKDKGGS